MQGYMVTAGSYSDYSVCNVFLRKEDAEKYIADRSVSRRGDYNDIEDIEIHEGPVAQVTVYSANWSDNGNEIRVWDWVADEGDYQKFASYTASHGYINATGVDKEKVVKAVSDYKARYLAEKEGIA